MSNISVEKEEDGEQTSRTWQYLGFSSDSDSFGEKEYPAMEDSSNSLRDSVSELGAKIFSSQIQEDVESSNPLGDSVVGQAVVELGAIFGSMMEEDRMRLEDNRDTDEMTG
jgi:hypothetical protein